MQPTDSLTTAPPAAAPGHVVEALFDALADSPAGVALIGGDGHFVRANTALTRMLGRSPMQLRWRDVFGDATGGDEVLRVRRPDGAVRRLRCRTRALDGPTALAHFEDVTGKRDAAALGAVVARVSDAVVTTDPDGRVAFLNDAAERMFGVRCADVAGDPITDRFVHHADRARARAWARALAAGEPVPAQVARLRRSDGSAFTGELTVFAVRDGDAMLGIGGIVRDVGDRMAQHQLRRIIDQTPNVIALKDLEGRCRLINARGARELHGREPEHVIGRSDHELFGSELADRLRAQDRDVIAAGEPMTFQDDMRQGDGHVRSYLTTKFPIVGPDGQPTGVGQIAAEVTEIRRAQADRAQLAAVIEAAPDAIVTADRDGRIATWNRGAQRMFGLAAQEAVGRPYAETVMPPDERGRYRAERERIRAGGTVTLRARHVRADGTVFPAQISAAPIAPAGGTLSMIRDISDRVSAEAKLKERAAQLERSNADLERFAYAASHDLQEPLRSITLGAASLGAAAAERLDDDERALLERIEAGAARLSAQVRALMEVAQVTHGHRPVDAVLVEVAVRDALDALRAAAEAAATAIDVRPLPAVEVPRAELSLVLQNLIANAIKYHRRDIPPRIVVSGRVFEGYMELRVADNGVGLSEAERARIFSVFERAQPGVPGTGLGLAVARRMLEHHGGSISVASAGPGRGSQFTVRMPA